MITLVMILDPYLHIIFNYTVISTLYNQSRVLLRFMKIKDLFIKLCSSLIQKFNGTKIFAVAKDYFYIYRRNIY